MTAAKKQPALELKTENNKLAASDFVHLHNHSQYSLLDGLTKVPALIDRTRELGMEAVAITDHGTLSGLIEFYKEASANDVRPVLGMETYVAARKHTDKDPAKDKPNHHLIILAMNMIGYQNLMRLSTIANLQGFYYRPRIDHELLEKYNEGLIVLSGCIGGEIGDALRQDQYDKAKQTAQWYKSIFGDRYYFEVQDHGHAEHPSAWAEQVAVTERTFKLAKELDIPCVVTSDAHYLKHGDQEAHEILLCVQTGSFLSDEKRMSLKEFELHVTSPADIIRRWGKDHPEVILNSKKIAERCDVQLELGKILIPKFPVPKGETEKSYLEKLVYRGLAWRYGGVAEADTSELTIAAAKKTLPPDISERAAYELGVVEQMGFSGYFLIISDFINWGKNQGIVFGPGRGSAAGSIVSYSLKITELDPMEYDLLFERFLNPDRISMPDIDIDIQDSRRDEVIQYCVEKYGTERVANIVTFGRMAARNAVRDVARVLQVPYADADRLAKMIPPPIQGRHTPLEKSLKDNAELKAEYEENETAKRVFDLATQLEGTIRSHGVHAAGVVIAPRDIVHYAPLEMAQKGVVATQYSMGPIEDLGLLKIDFLGLSNLTIIKNALRIIKRVHDVDISVSEIPLDDKKTFELLARGDTTGVFQLESSGMKRYLKQLKPTVFDDIIAMVALYRPGPMQWIEDFVARKHGQRKIEFVHETMKPALETTYGVMVYQEQVMQISKEMCGFSGGQADTLRKAIGKKIPEVLAKLKNEFIEGAIQKVGADRRLMEKFWKSMEAFAAYCFPKAHASCYALIAYQTAYLKANYPAAFMAALMTSDFDNTDRLAIEISECKHMGIEVLPPDINESFVEFAVVPSTMQVRFGMAAIKNVGTAAVEEVLRARNLDGPYMSLEDFFERVSTRVVNRKALESLIKAGAFDGFGERSYLLHNLDVLLAYSSRLQKELASGQTDIFGDATQSPDTMKPRLVLDAAPVIHDERELLAWERELLGLYLSHHPLSQYEEILSSECLAINKLSEAHENKTICVGGSVQDVREITTKNGQKMAFVKIADQFSELELILFPSVYQENIGIWERDRVVIVHGKASARDKDGKGGGEMKVLVNRAEEVTPQYVPSPSRKRAKKASEKLALKVKTKQSLAASINQRIYIRLAHSQDQATLLSLKQTIDKHKGETEVVLVVGPEETKQVIRLPMRVTADEQSLGLLGQLVGQENVKLH